MVDPPGFNNIYVAMRGDIWILILPLSKSIGLEFLDMMAQGKLYLYDLVSQDGPLSRLH
jgi:hypothetical protein